MTMSALPKHLQGAEKWKGTDWDTWLQRPLLKIKHWFAYGPRASEWWAKWRELPIPLFAMKGKGPWRWEESASKKPDIVDWEMSTVLQDKTLCDTGYYLAPTQYWNRWHVAIQWPFHVTMHFYLKKKNVPHSPNRPGTTTDGKLFFMRFGARRDSDRVYWFPSLFIGGSWN